MRDRNLYFNLFSAIGIAIFVPVSLFFFFMNTQSVLSPQRVQSTKSVDINRCRRICVFVCDYCTIHFHCEQHEIIKGK